MFIKTSKKEKNIITASIYYYDVDYNSNIACNVLHVLEKYSFFPPEKMHAGKLTNNRFCFSNIHTKDIFIQAYSEKNVFGIDMLSGDSATNSEYWRFFWTFTYLKNSKLVGACQFKPWNVLTLQTTIGRLYDPNNYQWYLACIKDLISLLKPFYASIDTIDKKEKALTASPEKVFVPDKVQEVYWGNYFGLSHCQKYGQENLLSLPVYHAEKIGDGVFFTLTDSVFSSEQKRESFVRNLVKTILAI